MKRSAKKQILPSVQSKITLAMVLVLLMILLTNVFVFRQTGRMVGRVNEVFASNAAIVELSETLEKTQNSMYGYLSTKSSVSLENFYRYEQEIRKSTESLNDRTTDSEPLMMESNIRQMTETYLASAEAAIQSRRGRDVEAYKNSYAEATRLYGYINSYIYALNSMRFRQNSENYDVLLRSMRVLEAASMALIIAVSVFALFLTIMFVRAMVGPLRKLASAANLVAAGDLSIEITPSDRQDEVGVMTNAFRKMLQSIRTYIENQRSSLEKEAKMKERELSMSAHLKDAQLKFLQAQINPHFLFNSLNAGSQLAGMEGAERTEDFLASMANYFRYNVKTTHADATLEEEIESADNYIYILNVRFSGDIHYCKQIDERIRPDQIRMPSMILQPIVENAVQHGISDHHDEGRITLTADLVGGDENETGETCVRITVADNGAGMTGKTAEQIMSRSCAWKTSEDHTGSAGIALANVISRLELYYGMENLFSVYSEGLGLGTEATVLLPLSGSRNEMLREISEENTDPSGQDAEGS